MNSPSPEPAARRLFLALWPDATTRDALAALAQRAAGPAATPAANLHLTLVFFGTTPAAREAAYRSALVDLSAPALDLTLDRLGWWARSRTLFAAPSQPPAALETLLATLLARLVPCGFTPENRPFRPHVTLARRKAADAATDAVLPPLAWRTERIVLAESVPGPTGSRYLPRAAWPVDGTR